jgi:CelD/BcsL family acetyltransferase involved in cellulose biosynthesis
VDAGQARIRIARSRSEVDAITDNWRELYAVARDRNPFANPDIQLAWLDHNLESRLFVVQAWRDNRLDWIAPMHIAPIGPGGVFGRCLMPFAAHDDGWLIELAPMLTRIDPVETAQEVVNAALEHADEWTWTEVTLAPEQGWLATTDDSRFPNLGGCRVLHKEVRVATVWDLADTWEATLAALKRNVRKSLGRAERKAADTFGEVTFALASESSEAAGFARRLVELNLRRADSDGHIDHSTPFGSARNVELLVDTIVRTVASKTGDVIELRDGNGAAVASLYTPYGHDTTFISHSGFDPAHWACSPLTLVTAHAARRAIELGHNRVTLSPGPHVSKSRWSQQLECHHSFLVVNGGRRDRARFLGYWMGRSAERFRAEGRLRRGA